MTQWERLNAELTKKHKSWASLAGYLGLKKQNVGNWKSRGIPAKYLRGCAEFVSRTHDWLDIGDEDTLTSNPSETPNIYKKNHPLAHIEHAQAAIKSNALEDDSDLAAALRAFGLRLENADDTTKRRVKAVMNDLVDDPANAETLLPVLKAVLAVPAPGKRHAA